MRPIVIYCLIIVIPFISGALYGQNRINFEQTTWENVINKATNEKKLIFIEFSSLNYSSCETIFNQILTNKPIIEQYNSNFINFRILNNNTQNVDLLNYYNIKSYPTYLFLKPDGVLVHRFGSTELSINDFITNAQLALEFSNEDIPLAQWDLDYDKKKMINNFVYDYLKKRLSIANLDNGDVIDQYALITSHNELLKSSILTPIVKNNQINCNGLFYKFLLKNKEGVKKSLQINEKQFNEIIEKSINYTFNKACKQKNSKQLENIIDAKLAYSVPVCKEDSLLIQNEYWTKFYYATEQPLKMMNFVLIYASLMMDMQKAEPGHQIVSPKAINKIVKGKELKKINSDISNSVKLRNAAQYVVEKLSNKKMLNYALLWSQTAIDLFENSCNYETHAYILYKLGKRNEAIACMEKACSAAFLENEKENTRGHVESVLIKMKRGERIW